MLQVTDGTTCEDNFIASYWPTAFLPTAASVSFTQTAATSSLGAAFSSTFTVTNVETASSDAGWTVVTRRGRGRKPSSGSDQVAKPNQASSSKSAQGLLAQAPQQKPAVVSTADTATRSSNCPAPRPRKLPAWDWIPTHAPITHLPAASAQHTILTTQAPSAAVPAANSNKAVTPPVASVVDLSVVSSEHQSASTDKGEAPAAKQTAIMAPKPRRLPAGGPTNLTTSDRAVNGDASALVQSSGVNLDSSASAQLSQPEPAKQEIDATAKVSGKAASKKQKSSPCKAASTPAAPASSTSPDANAQIIPSLKSSPPTKKATKSAFPTSAIPGYNPADFGEDVTGDLVTEPHSVTSLCQSFVQYTGMQEKLNSLVPGHTVRVRRIAGEVLVCEGVILVLFCISILPASCVHVLHLCMSPCKTC